MLTKVRDFPINSLNKTPFNQTTHLLITNSILQQALLFSSLIKAPTTKVSSQTLTDLLIYGWDS